MKLKLIILILISLLALKRVDCTVLTVKNDGMQLETEHLRFKTRPFMLKINDDIYEVGKVGKKGLAAVLYEPFSFNFDAKLYPLEMCKIGDLSFRLRLGDNSFLYTRAPRTQLSFTYHSRYISLVEAVYFKGAQSDALFQDIRRREDLEFSRLFLFFDTKYISTFCDLDYCINAGLYTVFGIKLSLNNYYASFIYGDALTGLGVNRLKQKFAFGVKDPHLTVDIEYSYGDLPPFLESFRAMSFKYDISLNLPSLSIKREGWRKFSEQGRLSLKDRYKLVSTHYEADSDGSFFIKAHNLRFGLDKGYSILSYKWNFNEERSLGFTLTFFKECSLYIKILL